MIAPKGFYVIHQPKHRIPGVLDLNERGLFKARPFVTSNWSYRIISDQALQIKLQFICLVEKETTVPETGQRYNFAVESHLIDLDEQLAVKSEDLAAAVADAAIREELLDSLEEFKNSYIPLDEHKKVDLEGLRKKLTASIADRKQAVRKELVRKNATWVDAAIPRLVQDFRRSFYFRIEDRLYDNYQRLGGGKTEDELIRKINLFNRVYDNDGQDLLRKPDGGRWKDEDEIWECWVGFAGDETEAKQICRTMNTVLRPLADKTADGQTADG